MKSLLQISFEKKIKQKLKVGNSSYLLYNLRKQWPQVQFKQILHKHCLVETWFLFAKPLFLTIPHIQAKSRKLISRFLMDSLQQATWVVTSLLCFDCYLEI